MLCQQVHLYFYSPPSQPLRPEMRTGLTLTLRCQSDRELSSGLQRLTIAGRWVCGLGRGRAATRSASSCCRGCSRCDAHLHPTRKHTSSPAFQLFPAAHITSKRMLTRLRLSSWAPEAVQPESLSFDMSFQIFRLTCYFGIACARRLQR